MGAQPAAEVDDFDQARLGAQWSTLRRPAEPAWLSLTERPSHLRIRGGRSPQSRTGQSLVAVRVSQSRCAFEATVDFQPTGYQHLAGVTAYYNTRNWHLLYLTADDTGARVLRVATRDRGVLTVYPPTIVLPTPAPLRLGLDICDGVLSLRFDDGDGAGWRSFGPSLDATVVSDEHAAEPDGDDIGTLGFTGAFVGLWVWDLDGHGHHADFDVATYRALP